MSATDDVRLERVFGRDRLRMATGSHVEVFREAAAPGERRRYTKRFLATGDGDFRQWTEREWRILALLFGNGVKGIPEVVRFDLGAGDGTSFVQTWDAGPTVDQWATLIPVVRDGRTRASVFEDCAHWFALAHHCLRVLADVHRLRLVHLDLKADNVCIPHDPPQLDPRRPGTMVRPVFERLALIDFAFSLVSGERLATPLPIGAERSYAYQSPRLLAALDAGRQGDLGPTQRLDWRCDLHALAAMLERYLPSVQSDGTDGWTRQRRDHAALLVERLRACHDTDPPEVDCHDRLLSWSVEPLRDPALMQSLARGWTLAEQAPPAATVTTAPTPMTRLAPPVRPPVASTHATGDAAADAAAAVPRPDLARTRTPLPVAPAARRRGKALALALLAGVAGGGAWLATRDAPVAPPAVTASKPAQKPPPPRVNEPAARAARREGDSTSAPSKPPGAGPATQARTTERTKAEDPAKDDRKNDRGTDERKDERKDDRGPDAERDPPPPTANAQEPKARELLSSVLPKAAAAVDPAVAEVLLAAANAHGQWQDRDVQRAAASRIPAVEVPGVDVDADAARRLNAQALRAYWDAKQPAEALRLQRQAYAAHPLDPEIVGNLAFYHLRTDPPDPRRARQLALQALGVRGRGFPAGRVEDWTALGVASALAGRSYDAEHAFLVVLALNPQVDKSCRTAVGSVQAYGAALEPAARALLARVHARGRSGESAWCAWPPDFAQGR